jgi:tripartite-type tricarboxylate transporter receptor subunit TctC
MAGELFKTMAGIDVVHVPYRNSGDARTGVISGQVQMMIDAVTAMAPNVAAGQVRALATTGKARSSVLPDVPTATEVGFAKMITPFWLGVVAPAGTPSTVVSRLNGAINESLRSPELAGTLAKLGVETKISSPDAFAAFVAAEREKWTAVVKAAGVRVD